MKLVILLLLLSNLQAETLVYNNRVILDTNMTIIPNSILYFTDIHTGNFIECKYNKKWVCKIRESI